MQSESLIYKTDASLLVVVLLLLMLLFIFVGRKVGSKVTPQPEGHTGTVVSAILGLMAFLLAFTFGMSGSRFDTRRKNIVDEANAIGTAIILADLYPEEQRKAFREDFKVYVEERIHYFENGYVPDSEIVQVDHGPKLWNRAAQLSHHPENLLASQKMIPALTDMLSLSTVRLIGELSRVPDSIVWMLLILAMVSAFYLGYSSSSRPSIDWLVSIGFCVIISLIIFITLDLDRPRRGLIQLSTSEKAMTDLRKLF
ncbi:hypothetical protein BH09BAC3_BH09BAC3_27380 [soil metagenome]